MVRAWRNINSVPRSTLFQQSFRVMNINNGKLANDCGEKNFQTSLKTQKKNSIGFKLGKYPSLSKRVANNALQLQSTTPIFQTDNMPTDVQMLRSCDVDKSINLSIAMSGLSTTNIQFHVRQECINLWSFLDDGVDKVKFVRGPPGVGKSIEVYLYAMYQSKSKGTRLLYIHSDEEQYSIVFRENIESNEIKWTNIKKKVDPRNLQYENLADWFDLVIANNQIDFPVIDGNFDEKFYYAACNAKKSKLISSLIICTSFRAMTIKSDYNLLQQRYEMSSWTKEDYEMAIKSGAVEGKDFDMKYFYAGGNIKLLQRNCEDIKDYMDDQISRVDVDVEEYSKVLRGVIGYKSESSLNSLMSIFRLFGSETESTFISEYVCKAVSKHCSATIIDMCRNSMSDDPIWQYWVTKMDVLGRIERIKALEVWDSNNICVLRNKLPTKKVLKFCDVSDLKGLQLEKGQYILPKAYYQHFDALYVMESNKLRIIQITNDNSRYCNLDALLPLVEMLNIQSIEYVTICRREHFGKFTFPVLSSYSNLIDKIGNEHIVWREVCYEKPLH
eukprot:gene5540-11161_t